MRIVITLDIEGVEKDKIAVFAGEKPVKVELPDGKCSTLANGECISTEPCMHTPVDATEIVHNEDGSATVTHTVDPQPEPAPAPKKRGRKRKTVSIETPAQQETRELQEAAARELAGIPEADIKADIGHPGQGTEPAPVAAPEPAPEAAIKADIPAVQVPVCPVCKEPMNVDERYDAFLCIKDGQFNNTIKPSQIAAQTVATPKAPPAVPEVKPVVVQAVLTEEEQKSIKARLGKYWVSILPEAGMTAADGKSINAKLTQFANSFAEGREWPNSRAWNAKQWDMFLGFMDGMVGAKGAKALVAHINQEIGSK